VRETFKATYGVSYIETTSGGGSVNVKLTGKSFNDFPGRTMRRKELENKQVREHVSRVEDISNSRIDNFASEKHAVVTVTPST